MRYAQVARRLAGCRHLSSFLLIFTPISGIEGLVPLARHERCDGHSGGLGCFDCYRLGSLGSKGFRREEARYMQRGDLFNLRQFHVPAFHSAS